MKTYENVSGESPITAYESGEDSITIKYMDGSVYRFTYKGAGGGNVEQMKKYAMFGHGLSGFIIRFVGKECGVKLN